MSTVSATTPIEIVAGVYATLPERAEIGRRRLGRPLTLTEKILINHLRRPGARSSSEARATPTSIPIASPCRTPRHRWRCCSS